MTMAMNNINMHSSKNGPKMKGKGYACVNAHDNTYRRWLGCVCRGGQKFILSIVLF